MNQQQLISLIKTLSINGQRKPANKSGRRRRRQRKAQVAVAAQTPVGQPGMPARPNPRNGTGRVAGSGTQMRVSRGELCKVLTTGDKGDASTVIPLDPLRSKENFPWLAGLAASWDRIQWHRLSLSWRSSVGTTSDGSVAYGPDFNSPPSGTKITRKDVVSLQPCHDHPVWQSTDSRKLAIPVGMLRSRNQFVMGASDLNDATPCSVVIYVQGAAATKVVGELWIDYDVTFSGPRKA